MAIEKVIKIKVDSNDAVKGINKVDKSLDKTGKQAQQTKAEISTLTGSAGAKFSGLVKSVKSVTLGFKSLKFAIAASGIGLLVLGIAAVSAAFKGSEEGQNKFAKLMSVIGAVTGNVIDLLADLGDFIIDLFSGQGTAMQSLKSFGKAIYDVLGLPLKTVIDTAKTLGKVMGALFSGDVSGAFDSLNKGIEDIKGNFNEATTAIDGATKAVKDFAKQNIDEVKAAADVANKRAKADKIERNLIVDKANAEREIADLRLKAKDLNNVSAKEREAALKRVLEIQDGLITRETEVLELRRDAQIAENTFARSNKENLDAEQKAIAAVIEAQTRRVNQQRTIQRELTAAENEQESERKAIAGERFKSYLEENKLAEEREKQRVKYVEQEKKDAAELKGFEDEEEDGKFEAEEERLQKITDIRNEFKLKEKELNYEEKIAKIEQEEKDALAELERLEATLYDKQKIREFYAEKKADTIDTSANQKIKSDEVVASSEATIRENNQKGISLGIDLIASLGKKSKALQAAALIAEHGKSIATSIISTNAANTALPLKYVGVPTPISAPAIIAERAANKSTLALGIASSAVALGKGLASLKSGSGGGSAGGSAASGGGATPSAPSFNLVEGSGSNQIAQGLQASDSPIQAVVVSGDITTAQSVDRNIVENSTI
tara:strand:- start:609 stop:2600 length:1992 start_codon:yes stop_codon:yes gene_type:complete